MKYSVLIPTKNRLSLLELSIASILYQDYVDWEIIVSDNASTESVQEFIVSLNDPRIRYTRSDHPISVTENWNRAFDLCVGEYVVMLGDDDALLPGFMRLNADLIARFGKPDIVFVQGIQYAYPGVMPGHRAAFIQVANCEFLGDKNEPFVLGKADARHAVESAFSFRVVYPFNSQYYLVKRSTMLRLTRQGRFYHSPFPDYYAANLLMIEATKIVVQPLPLVAVGISPKSFGYYYFNDREFEGVDFLNNSALDVELAPVRREILPGSAMNSSWLIAMETANRHIKTLPNIPVRHDLYRFLQFRWVLRNRGVSNFLLFLITKGRWREITFWAKVLTSFAVQRGILRRQVDLVRSLDQFHEPYPQVWIYVKNVPHQDILEFVRCFLPEAFLDEYLKEWRKSHDISIKE